MPGLIKREDIDELRSRARIEEIVSGHVCFGPRAWIRRRVCARFTMKRRRPSMCARASAAGIVSAAARAGDVISFVEKVEHISFVEAVELLARKAGMELHYEEERGGRRDQPSGPSRARLIDAHRVAVEFYEAQLHTPRGGSGPPHLHRTWLRC